MRSGAERPVLFRVAAGPRLGFGHLLRARALASVIPHASLVSVRGPRVIARDPRLGLAIAAGSAARLFARCRPRLVVIDDPNAREAGKWCAAARAHGVPVASLHDLGRAAIESDLAIDGSACRVRVLKGRRRLTGCRFAVLPASVAAARRARRSRPDRPRIVVTFGGGAVGGLAHSVGRAIARARLDVDVDVILGPGAGRLRQRGTPQPNLRFPSAGYNLVDRLTRADVAVLGGGRTLYEACALGVPSVTVPVVAAQRQTCAAFVRAGAARGVPGRAWTSRARLLAVLVCEVERLLDDAALRRRVASRARGLVPARGVFHVARELVLLAR